ncbi:uncharacterized protein LOC106658820 [Trichogramma pretiosum]|uniref:uncharacterized protein LOC106658820 n=1 Tax=Trichogramma pretiosum TaxID=7493 RepID=UPI000C71C141|nr:uncharacterized protein LOC106658820 [Trichogramma pretiosum]
MELLRRFRKKPRYSDMLPDDVLIKIFESLTIGERLKAERTCTRWSYLTKLAWSHTTCEEVCNYFMKKRRLTADRVILVLSRCAQYLTHICLNRSHHAIKGIENEEKAQELFEVLRRKARKLERIQWDFNVPADTLVKFYFTRINLLENFDDTGLFKEIEFKKLLDLLERARNLKFYTWNVGNGELRRINYAQTVFDKLPRDLKSLKVNCTVNLFWMKIIIQHLHKFENLTEFSMRGTLMYTQDQADRRSIFTFDHNAQLPAWLEQVEIDGIFPDDKINFLRKLKSLRHLSLTFGSITLDDLHLLINNNPQLEHLVLRKMDDFEEEKFEIVSQLPNLKFLRLENLPRLQGTSLMNCKQIQGKEFLYYVGSF